jgi:competence protein ComEA
VHRGAPPSSASAEPPPAQPDEPEPPAPLAALALGAAAAEPAPPAEPPADATDLNSLLGPDAADAVVDATDLNNLLGPDAADAAVVDLAPLVGPEAAEATPIVGLTNINSADLDALIALPGIGPALARRIVEHREEHGPFSSVEQLIDIQGIGSRNIDEFRHLITV